MLTITIQSDLDFTPTGKRSARVVTHDRGVQRIRWHVGGRRYHALPVTAANTDLTKAWLANAGAANHCPQPWEPTK